MANEYLPGTIQIPSSLEVIAITQAKPAVATVSVNAVTESNSFQAGQMVYFNIPFGYGMQQLNRKTVKILSVTGNDISLDLDTRLYDPFSVPASGLKPAMMAPSGSMNLEYSNNTNDIAFQSLNNMGN